MQLRSSQAGVHRTTIFLFYEMQLSRLFILSLTGKEPLPIKRLGRFIPAEKLFQEMSGYTRHSLIAGHLLYLFFAVIIFSIERASWNHWQRNILKDLSHKRPAFLGDLIVAPIPAALPHPDIEASVTHEHPPVGEIPEGAGLAKEPRYVLFADDPCGWRGNVRILGVCLARIIGLNHPEL